MNRLDSTSKAMWWCPSSVHICPCHTWACFGWCPLSWAQQEAGVSVGGRGQRGRCHDWRLSLDCVCSDRRGQGSLSPSHLPRVALAGQEASGERVHISWKGLSKRGPALPGLMGGAAKQSEATLCQVQTKEKELIKGLQCVSLASTLVWVWLSSWFFFPFVPGKTLDPLVYTRMTNSACQLTQPVNPAFLLFLTQAPNFKVGSPQVLPGSPPSAALPAMSQTPQRVLKPLPSAFSF